MFEILLCIPIFFLSVTCVVLGAFGPLSKEQFKGRRTLAWKIVWGLRCWVGNLATFFVLFMGSAFGGLLTFSVCCSGLIVGMLITGLLCSVLRWWRIPVDSYPNLGPYRSLVQAAPHALPKTLIQKFHIFLVNFCGPVWDGSAYSTKKA
jgi:hypothetical protein